MEKKRYVYLTLALIITAITFTNSLLPASVSSEQSGFFHRIIENILLFFKISTENINLSYLIRKGAHFTQFFLLGFFYFMFFYLSNKESYEPYLLTLNYGLLIAMTDEFIQYFIPGRAMLIEDVFIDLFGVITVLLIILIITILNKLIKKGATK